MDANFLTELLTRGWQLQAATQEHSFDETAYAKAPDELKRFMASFGTLGNAEDTVWLISAQDIHQTDSKFPWNAFELLSLEAAVGDDHWEQEIQAFWAMHLPVMLCVKGAYEYIAFCVAGQNQGKFVQGSEPEFEEAGVIAQNLEEFQSWLLANAA